MAKKEKKPSDKLADKTLTTKLLQGVFGDAQKRILKRMRKKVQEINNLEPKYEKMSDDELAGQTEVLREKIKKLTKQEQARLAKAKVKAEKKAKKQGTRSNKKEKLADDAKALDEVLADAYALVREATKRVLGMRHFDVQMIGGIVLHEGNVAEMKTGEGKTLVSTLPAYLNALEGKGVHVVSVNDYLVKRDAEWMGEIHKFLGLSVGYVLNFMTAEERREAYNCDITYVTNNELGFDYLRDNMVVYKNQLVLRDLHYAIIDEVDSVLIDEARTPLIISGQSGKSTKLYEVCDILARQMQRGEDMEDLSKMDAIMGVEREETGDFIVNEKDKIVNLTAQGIEKVEKFFQIDNLADPENIEIQHNVILALRANNLMFKDQDYVVKDDQVLIVDEFTGRIMPGRRYSDGLHQAIEAKEHVKVKRESKTLATITFQNFFNKFEKKSGMTGTALTEEKEFRDIYGMDVIEIPTNRPVARIDHQDAVYKTRREKLHCIVEAVKEANAKGQPVLVGTITIEASEELSRLLTKEGIKHKVLNAKFHEMEAEIVADAGIHGSVTIATNMAGRGTDIKLDDESKAAGGLMIIGTERHESRRIDNQLRGRSGRQGDPGESRFYISLEDDLMRLFGSDRLIGAFNALGIPEYQEIQHSALSKSIESAQKKIESNNFGIRKNLLEYDQVMNEQREIIYDERRRVLDGESMREPIYKMITDTVESAVDMVIGDDTPSDDWNIEELNEVLLPIIPLTPISRGRIDTLKKNAVKQQLKEEAVKLYEAKEAEFPEPEAIREVERVVLLKTIDRKWMDHIDDMDQLRQGVGLQAYGQRDPLVEYKMSGYEMFDEMTQNIKEETVKILYHIHVEQKVEREQVAKVTGTNKDDSVAKGPTKRMEAKVYPNDPCPCGSGKKYKQCHGAINRK